MESNGKPGMIQCSQKTADLLTRAGKGSWVTKRDEMVQAKGKGMLQTYWVEPRNRGGSSHSPSLASSDGDDVHHVMLGPIRRGPDVNLVEKLVDWNMEHFTTLAKRIVARRAVLGGGNNMLSSLGSESGSDPAISPRSEVTEIISLPKFDFQLSSSRRPSKLPGPLADVVLAPEVVDQLRHFISTVARMYWYVPLRAASRRPSNHLSPHPVFFYFVLDSDHPFHNFEHATHVTSSMVKLLQRVVTPDVSTPSGCKSDEQVVEALAANLHASTYGITSDPLTQFAVVFAALVHDVDHPGVGNGQLVSEGDPIAEMYKDGSPAEQNSVSIAWNLLMSATYRDLRSCLFSSDDDLTRFRQLVVNAVIATDIFDPQLKAFREARWGKAFANYGHDGKETATSIREPSDETNRRATVVIEVMIQCSDVAHTMQHWMVYQKWNKRLFHEMYLAYVNGRHPTNPADSWYNGELWFFDNYVIPLATKLRECRVFGVSCDEFLDYATDNRNEWEAKGHAIVAELVREVESVKALAESDNRSENRRPIPSQPEHDGLVETISV
jgi:3'5'-cyclic nucleotide phosphodiesterase